MTKSDRMLLERVAQSPVEFRYEPQAGKAHPRLVSSSISPSQQKHLHRLAVAGYLSEHLDEVWSSHLPHTGVRFTLTAKGREELGIYAKTKRPVNGSTAATDAELAAEGQE